MLGGILGGSAITQTQPGNGLGFVVIDPSAFVSKERFGEMMLELRDYIKSAETAQGFDEVLLPGEPDCKVREERIRDGIPVDENSWRLIEQAVAKLGIMAPMTSGVTR